MTVGELRKNLKELDTKFIIKYNNNKGVAKQMTIEELISRTRQNDDSAIISCDKDLCVWKGYDNLAFFAKIFDFKRALFDMYII